MSEPLLKVSNHHVPGCGDPPVVDDASCYVGYFENAHGEQWIFTFNRETKAAELRGGDAGWNEVYQVHDGKVLDLILSADESQWLKACWSAAAAFRR